VPGVESGILFTGEFENMMTSSYLGLLYTSELPGLDQSSGLFLVVVYTVFQNQFVIIEETIPSML
jgi:hypothetical protein